MQSQRHAGMLRRIDTTFSGDRPGPEYTGFP